MSNVTSLRRKKEVSAHAEAPLRKVSRIHLLGTMRIIGPGGENILPPQKKTQAVLAFLCLAEGQYVSRGQLAGLIWDRSAEMHARDSLRQALNDLDQVGGSWRVERNRQTVRLDTTACWIDAFASPDRPDQLLDGLHGTSPAFDHWLMGERARFEYRWQTNFEEDLDDLVAKNAAPEARAMAARKLLNFVPTHDTGVRRLMSAYLEMDDRALAIREYERFRVLVEHELGISPSEKTVALYEEIRRISRTKAGRPMPPSPHITGDDANQAEQGVNRLGSEAPIKRAPEPSIAVLPFQVLSTVRGHDLIAQGLTEDLIEAISRVPSLFVISRLSTAAFKSRDRAPLDIGAVLGVSYILSGSVRIIGDRLRLVVELTDIATGRAISVSRFDEKFSDLLDLQNSLAERVVCSLAPHLRSAELRRVRSRRPEDHTAYDLFLRAQENMHSASRGVFETSERLFSETIAREPYYATALAWLAHWHVLRVGQGWSPDPAYDADQADHFAQRAIECDAAESLAFAVQGHIAAYLRKDFDRAFGCFETALRLNPNSARAWLWNANAHAYVDDGPRAVEKVKRAMALSPFDPLMYAYSCSANIAYLADRQYERAVEFGLRCIRENRSYTSGYRMLIPALVQAGREAEARVQAHQLLTLQPAFTAELFRRRFPGSASPLGELCGEALVRAGIPRSV
jgi:TolB-like protein/DNA-binding SARP family transcriptional activator